MSVAVPRAFIRTSASEGFLDKLLAGPVGCSRSDEEEDRGGAGGGAGGGDGGEVVTSGGTKADD